MRSKAFLLALVLAAGAARVHAAPGSDWDGLAFLVGEWRAEGAGQPGSAAGGFSFKYEAGGKVLTRHSSADYPASNGRPAAHHEDLLVIYRAPQDGPLKAMYFDSEGHVIRYGVEVDQEHGSVRMVSEADQAGPRFRLTYQRGAEGTVVGDFEMQAPGKTEFSPYLHWTSRRAAAN